MKSVYSIARTDWVVEIAVYLKKYIKNYMLAWMFLFMLSVSWINYDLLFFKFKITKNSFLLRH